MIDRIEGVLRIRRVVAFFDVMLNGGVIPIASMKIRVVENGVNDFTAHNNLFRVDRHYQTPEGVAGIGESIEEAVEDLLKVFFEDLDHNRPEGGYTQQDFCWADPETF